MRRGGSRIVADGDVDDVPGDGGLARATMGAALSTERGSYTHQPRPIAGHGWRAVMNERLIPGALKVASNV